MHTCSMLMVVHGGFGFHTMEVYQRFGPETAVFFFKVSRRKRAGHPGTLLIIERFIGNHVVRPLVECHCMLQQAIGPFNVHGAHPNTVYDQVGERNRRPNYTMERRRHHRRVFDMPTHCEELGLYHARQMWKSAELLLCHICSN
jgi:hypothetical protein